jgi:uncharacterized protein (DUF4415 family)
MNEKSPNTHKEWSDPDDAPELTDADFARGTWRIGEQVVSRQEAQAALPVVRMGRPPVQSPKQAVNIRLGADILTAFKATGKGWQTRIDNALRDWLKEHKPA